MPPWQVEKDTGPPEVLPPPSELQSDARENPSGVASRKTPAAPPGVNAPPSHSEENESGPALFSALPSDGGERPHMNRALLLQTRQWEGALDGTRDGQKDDWDGAGAIGWDSARERFLAR